MEELAPSDRIYDNALHPYTKALISAIPTIDEDGETKERIMLAGDLPSPIDPPGGCAFHTRCPYATEKCRTDRPELKEIEPGHFAACHNIG